MERQTSKLACLHEELSAALLKIIRLVTSSWFLICPQNIIRTGTRRKIAIFLLSNVILKIVVWGGKQTYFIQSWRKEKHAFSKTPPSHKKLNLRYGHGSISSSLSIFVDFIARLKLTVLPWLLQKGEVQQNFFQFNRQIILNCLRVLQKKPYLDLQMWGNS